MRRALFPAGAAALMAVLLGGAGTEARAQQASRETPIVRTVRKTQAAVVSIKVEKKGSSGRKEGVGTGVIVDERGFVVTNRHVIASADHVIVRLVDGTDLAAQILVEDPGYDLAILRIEPNGKLQALPLGPSSDLMVGETVIAVGHPYGFINTWSTGIVSALGRDITMPGGELLTDLIQITASINQGNSGGPLLNVNGELIGINVALREGAQGIAFALNADKVQQVLSRHLSASRLAKLAHGLTCVEVVTPEGAVRQQVMVREVANPSALAAGVKNGDRIVRVGMTPVSNRFDVERALWDHKVGDKVPLTIAREGKVMTVEVTLHMSSEIELPIAIKPAALAPAVSPNRGAGQ